MVLNVSICLALADIDNISGVYTIKLASNSQPIDQNKLRSFFSIISNHKTRGQLNYTTLEL